MASRRWGAACLHGVVLVLCVCAGCAAGQQRYETAPRPDPPGVDTPWDTGQSATQNRLQQSTNRFGEARDGANTDGQVGPQYDPEHKRFGGSDRNPYRGGSTYRNRFSGGVVGYDGVDREVEGVGILGGWRDDLQGQRRPEAAFLNPYKEVRTLLGPVTGFVVQLYDKPRLPEELWPANLQLELQKYKMNVTTFLGIPYAQPPVDEGRFKPPRAHPGWQTLPALDFGPACPQPARYVGVQHGIRQVAEDCLYLNVYTPSISSNVRDKYAVLFYIHGGEFTHGASSLFPAHMLSAWGEVVVVTFNYRLGALGFLSTGDEYSPGNYGLLDQVMALRWVHENIIFFNGDPEKITVMGPGAGAASAGLLAVSPRSAHMVHQVIGESGSPLADWAAIYDIWRVQNTSRIFGEKIGCNIDTSYKLMNCLNKARNAIEIGNVEFKPDVGTFPWAPYIETNTTFPGNDWYEEWQQDDWRVLPDFPERLFRRRQFNQKLRLLTGVNRDEAAFFVYENRSLSPDFVVTQEFVDVKIWEWVKQYNYTLNPEGVYEAIRYMYTYWPDRHNTTWIREMYIDMLSDALYKAPVDSMVKLMMDLEVTTYQYVLNTTVEALKAPLWREVPHDLEYYFLTGAPFMDPEFFAEDIRIDRRNWTEGDRNMSQLFIETFTNFAKYGRPTPRQIFNLINWQPVLEGDLRFLSINNTFNSTMFSNYRQTECSFWSRYLPTVVGHLVPTYRPSTEFWWEPQEPLQIAFWSVTALAFLLLVIVGICCCLWQGAKKKTTHLYEESFMDDAFDVRENSHFAAKSSKPPSIATLSGAAAASGSGGGAMDAPRHDARSLARDIQQDRRRRSDAGRQQAAAQARETPTRVPSSQAQSATELEPLRGAAAAEPFTREPSRSSARSRDTVQYATLEHTGALAASAAQQQLLKDGAPGGQSGARHPQMAPNQRDTPGDQAGHTADPRQAGRVPVLPARPTDRVHPSSQPQPQDAFVPHAKSIPNMTEYEERPPSRIRTKSVEQLDRDVDSETSRPGTPKVPRFHFVEPYDVVQLPDDYQYNSNPNLAAGERPRTPRTERRPADWQLQPPGYVPPEARPVPPTAAPRTAPPAAAAPPARPKHHQAQIVVQLASRPQETSARTGAAPGWQGGAGQPAPSGTPPPAYQRRAAATDTPNTSLGYPPTVSERSLPDTPSAGTDRSFESYETEGRATPRRYVPPETDL
ncbi:Neuroligin-3 [Amphibalanus amphitrite]|uniref:Neuroligin-3 n=1 Tax=Amphibalanus amphitrite TaxID=1232801 RepID=A0A6A4X147_AMPAM|nr:uncharacterized protein LOC122365947 [Amphibalanus amphitrite]KAF0313426.1 Neuroligin-3 [Amphibalanus amphitrite]